MFGHLEAVEMHELQLKRSGLSQKSVQIVETKENLNLVKMFSSVACMNQQRSNSSRCLGIETRSYYDLNRYPSVRKKNYTATFWFYFALLKPM